MKIALIRPLLKKITLDPDIYKNYRPVSNLSFLSKLIEKVVVNRLFSHMTDNNLHDLMQSAYKPYHSTESALLRVKNDLLSAMDEQQATYFAMIDLSAAFDTVDHNVLLSFINETIGIEGTAWKWFQSYLTGRSQQVEIDSIRSDLADLLYGVPQGSVLGPIKYCIYTLPIGAIIRHHGLNYAVYADDTQVYLSFNIKDSDTALQRLNSCLADIRTWMLKNKLKINDDKTEFLLIGSRHIHKNINTSHALTVGDSSITTSAFARNLGVMFDNQLTMEKHISSVCRATHLQLRNIGSIRHVLTESSAAQLVHSLVSSRIDYCNSLLLGVPDNQLKRLQNIQNHAARIVARITKYDHITPTLRRLHWLPVRQRIAFKTLLLTFKCIHGMAPSYLSDLLIQKPTSYRTRSSVGTMLVVPKVSNRSTFGERRFSVQSPMLWNKLPMKIRQCTTVDSFKSQLKTFLFNEAYC